MPAPWGTRGTLAKRKFPEHTNEPAEISRNDMSRHLSSMKTIYSPCFYFVLLLSTDHFIFSSLNPNEQFSPRRGTPLTADTGCAVCTSASLLPVLDAPLAEGDDSPGTALRASFLRSAVQGAALCLFPRTWTFAGTVCFAAAIL